jgi:hypothetical protein
MGRKNIIDRPFRPVLDEIFTNYRFSTHIESLPGLKIEPAPKSKKRRIATKSPKHKLTQNIVYQYIKIGAPIAIGIVFSWFGGKKISFRSGLKI